MLPNDWLELRTAVRGGRKFKYVFFWGHTPRQTGVIDKSVCSQWFPAAFKADGITYPTAEHYMMAQKARLFGDDAAFAAVLRADTPQQAKELGRQVRGFDHEVWERERLGIVFAANHAKFSQHSDLKDFLIRTGDAVLVEASPYDRIWGIGLGQDDPHAANPLQWRGSNLLGFTLMRVRAALKVV